MTDPRNVISNGSGDPYGEGDIRDGNRTRSPFDFDAVRSARGGDLRHMALEAIEQARFSDSDSAVLTSWMDDEDSEEVSGLARHIIVTSAPDYRRNWIRAFKAAARGGQNPEAVSYLDRAMSLTDGAGGFAVPQDLDPALILTSDGSTNPVRQIARVVQTTSNVWDGLSTTHAAWSNDAEAAEVSDDQTTFVQPSITVFKAQVFIPFSIEIGLDYPGFTTDLRIIIANGKDDLDATNFVLGTGTNQPIGIVVALTGGSGTTVQSVGTDAFAVADVYSIEEGIAAKYRQRAQWISSKVWYNDVRQFDTAGGAGMWERIGAGQPPQLLGYPAHESSAIDSTITGGAENYMAVLGDWSNYVIVDRVGMTLELIPHLIGGSQRPTGQRGFYGWARTGADSVNDGGFVLFNVS